MKLQKVLGCVICATVCTTGCAKEGDAKAPAKEDTPSIKEGLGGLFGVKFGKVMSANETCETNNVGELAYEYTPEKQFKDFADYVIFATPTTRQVSQVRAVCNVDSDDADDVFESAVRSLEMKFKKIAIKHDSDTKVIFFENNDYIAVTKKYKKVMIDACSNKLRDLTKDEVAQAEKKIYAADIEALNLQPGMDKEDNRVYKIDAVLGQKFGDPFVGTGDVERMPDGYWVCEYRPKKRFMNCGDYKVFCTAKTKKAFMIRAIYEGGDTGTRHEHFHRVIEMATGRKMKQNDNGRDYHLQFGDVLIALERDIILDRITLDFARMKLYQQNKSEQKELKAKADSADMDAL